MQKRIQLSTRTVTFLGLGLILEVALRVWIATHDSSVVINTIRLINTNLLLTVLITAASVMIWKNPVVQDASSKLCRYSIYGLGGLLIQIALGSVVHSMGLGLVCPEFPNCAGDRFLPLSFTVGTVIVWIHRWWGVILLGLFIHLVTGSGKYSHSLFRPALFSLVLGVTQVLLGILTVLTSIHPHVRTTHAAVAYALWGILCYIAIRSGSLRWLWDDGRST